MPLIRFISLCLILLLPMVAAGEPRPSPELKFTTLEGRNLTLEQWKGNVVLVMFFSTDCSHCQRTARVLKPIYDEFKPRGLEVVGIAINPAAAGNLQGFATKYGAEFPLSLGTRGDCTRFAGISVMARFYVPYMFFIDRKGMIREQHGGSDRAFYRNEDRNIRTTIETLLKEPT